MVGLVVAEPRRWRHGWLRLLVLFDITAVLALLLLIGDELSTSRIQAGYLSRLAGEVSYQVKPGTTTFVVYPRRPGPYDQRLGHASLPIFLQRLKKTGAHIEAQARWSARMLELATLGLFPAYREKDQAGLSIYDRKGGEMYAARYPERIYDRYEEIPTLVVDTLLFIENRELLDPRRPRRNPAVEWDRLALATGKAGVRKLTGQRRGPGASTLATQIEKFRHSPEGRTRTADDKLLQMASASVRAYLDGPETLEAQRRIILSYINTLPLGAVDGYGEVQGVGDGLWAWFGTDFAGANALLAQLGEQDRQRLPRPDPRRPSLPLIQRAGAGLPGATPVGDEGGPAFSSALQLRDRLPGEPPTPGSPERDSLELRPSDRAEPTGPAPPPRPVTAEQGRTYRQALSLFLLQRKPGFFSVAGQPKLQQMTDRFLHSLAEAGVISAELRDVALAEATPLRRRIDDLAQAPPRERKAIDAIRSQLLGTLGVPGLYDLDRLDLTVHSTIDREVQADVERTFRQLADPAFVKANHLDEQGLLSSGDPAGVIYSFTLYEHVKGANLLRVQTDGFDGPFNLNDGMKLELGSTAKLRTLVSYLEVVAELHARLATRTTEALRREEAAAADRLTSWAASWLAARPQPGRTLPAMLQAALDRPYSGDPGESFVTGGGVIRFGNFRHQDDGKVVSVREGLHQSINLVFVRLLRDVVQYHIANVPGGVESLLADARDPRRRDYLERFADREGKVFLDQFYTKYEGLSPTAAFAKLVGGMPPVPQRLAVAYRKVWPEASREQFDTFLQRRLGGAVPGPKKLGELYEKYAPGAFNLQDQGYIARVHPLELWLVAHLREHPGATRSAVMNASRPQRLEVYTWLLKTSRKHAQDRRIRMVLDWDAYARIHEGWARLGYPFPELIPSLATALGSSGDRPRALAELVGVVLDSGRRYPLERVDQLHFAQGTPYETVVRRGSSSGQQVLRPEIAEAVRRELIGVVEGGTAKRVRDAFRLPDGRRLVVGGKTGTGDNRRDENSQGGSAAGARAVSRTGTFVFFVDERWFGVLTAYVPGPKAASYRYTSALPLAALGLLAPKLFPALMESERRVPADPGLVAGITAVPVGGLASPPMRALVAATRDNAGQPLTALALQPVRRANQWLSCPLALASGNDRRPGPSAGPRPSSAAAPRSALDGVIRCLARPLPPLPQLVSAQAEAVAQLEQRRVRQALEARQGGEAALRLAQRSLAWTRGGLDELTLRLHRDRDRIASQVRRGFDPQGVRLAAAVVAPPAPPEVAVDPPAPEEQAFLGVAHDPEDLPEGRALPSGLRSELAGALAVGGAGSATAARTGTGAGDGVEPVPGAATGATLFSAATPPAGARAEGPPPGHHRPDLGPNPRPSRRSRSGGSVASLHSRGSQVRRPTRGSRKRGLRKDRRRQRSERHGIGVAGTPGPRRLQPATAPPRPREAQRRVHDGQAVDQQPGASLGGRPGRRPRPAVDPRRYGTDPLPPGERLRQRQGRPGGRHGPRPVNTVPPPTRQAEVLPNFG